MIGLGLSATLGYAQGKKAPPPPEGQDTWADSLNQQVLLGFKAWKKSPAGGRRSRGRAAPALGVKWGQCTIVTLKQVWVTEPPKKGEKKGQRKLVVEEKPFDEPDFRSRNCNEVADAFITHEQKHVEQCQKLHDPSRLLRQDPNPWRDASGFDADAYGAFVKALRKSIADLARRCGWQGSTNETKQNPVDRETVDVVPTLKEAKQLAKALAKGKKP